MQIYIEQIKQVALQMGYDITTGYFHSDMEMIWFDYMNAGIEPYEAICLELGE